MASGWKIIAVTKRHGGEGAGSPMKEYFLVAIADQEKAIQELKERKKLLDAEIRVCGEATPEYLEWLDVQPGEICCVSAVS
jgi:hypothetical protein